MPTKTSGTFRVLALAGLLAVVTNLAAFTLVEAGPKTEWKYRDDGSNLPTEWQKADFDDSKWNTGRAPLGYGDPSLSTRVRFGNNLAAKYITTYFRRSFEVQDTNGLRQLLILLRIDDGAILYLSGKEIVRENIPAGPVNSRTTAERKIDGPEEAIYHRYVVSAQALVPGKNALAVEAHPSDPGSSDLFFDLLLKTYGEGEELRPAKVKPAALQVTLAYRQNHYVPAGVTIPDGYVDGGRRMEIDADGNVQTGREVMVVDRARDADLRKHLEYARSKFIASLPSLERATFLALYVDKQCSPPEGRQLSLYATTLVESEYRDKEMLLGKSISAGVCRHRALLFKMLADEAGLSVAVARGNFASGRIVGGHAWNELKLENGNKLIVDVMNPNPGFYFPETTEPIAQRYLTVGNELYYPKAKPAKD